MKKYSFIAILMVLVAFVVTSCGGGSVMTRAQTRAKQAIDWEKAGNMEMYVKDMKEAHEMDPDDVFIINDMAKVYWMENNIPEARAHYQECIQKAGNLTIGQTDKAEFKGKTLKSLCEDNLKLLEEFAAKQGK